MQCCSPAVVARLRAGLAVCDTHPAHLPLTKGTTTRSSEGGGCEVRSRHSRLWAVRGGVGHFSHALCMCKESQCLGGWLAILSQPATQPLCFPARESGMWRVVPNPLPAQHTCTYENGTMLTRASLPPPLSPAPTVQPPYLSPRCGMRVSMASFYYASLDKRALHIAHTLATPLVPFSPPPFPQVVA